MQTFSTFTIKKKKSQSMSCSISKAKSDQHEGEFLEVFAFLN